jgi:hypothetical protein
VSVVLDNCRRNAECSARALRGKPAPASLPVTRPDCFHKEPSLDQQIIIDPCGRVWADERLALLEPAIIQAILAGTQPRCMSLIWFQRNPLPLDWIEQRRVVDGFDA